jgi:hypothetical protein
MADNSERNITRYAKLQVFQVVFFALKLIDVKSDALTLWESAYLPSTSQAGEPTSTYFHHASLVSHPAALIILDI